MELRHNQYNKAITLVVQTLAFLMPLFFLPYTSEFFEFNKLALFTSATMLITLIWGIKMITSKKVNIIRSSVNIPLLILVIVYLLSTLFSLNTNISLFGKYGRWFPSLYAFVTFAVFYYIVAANVTREKAIKAVLMSFTIGTTLSSVIALLSYFGIYLGSLPYFQQPNFNTTGSPTTSAIVSSMAVIFLLHYLLNAKAQPTKILFVQALVVNFLVIALYNVLGAWVVLITGLVLTLLFVDQKLVRRNSFYITTTLGFVVAVGMVLVLPRTRSLIVNTNFSNELSMNAKTSWRVASNTVTDYPLLGAGPSTFGMNFPKYRPLELNSQDSWNVRFDKPHNQLFDTIGSLGIVGALVNLYFIFVVVKMVMPTKKGSVKGTEFILGIAVVSLLASLLFTYSTILTTFLFFLLVALLVSQKGDHATLGLSAISNVSLVGNITDSKASKEILQYIAVIPLAAYIGLWGFYVYKTYLSEYYIRQSIVSAQQNNGTKTYEFLQKAIAINPSREEYHNTFAQTNIALATGLASTGKELSDTDLQTVRALIAQAIRSSRVSTEVINPLSPMSWEIRANVYRALIGVAQDSEQWSIGAYNSAIQLDPTSPRLRLEAGGIYFATQDYLSAANLYRQASNLKPDYANAHYNLAQSLIQLQQYPLAQRELEATQRLVAQNSADTERILKDIETVKNLAGTQADTKPTVQELEAAEEEQVTEQEPLTEAGEIETLGGENTVELTTPEETADEQEGQEEEEQNPEEQPQE